MKRNLVELVCSFRNCNQKIVAPKFANDGHSPNKLEPNGWRMLTIEVPYVESPGGALEMSRRPSEERHLAICPEHAEELAGKLKSPKDFERLRGVARDLRARDISSTRQGQRGAFQVATSAETSSGSARPSKFATVGDGAEAARRLRSCDTGSLVQPG